MFDKAIHKKVSYNAFITFIHSFLISLCLLDPQESPVQLFVVLVCLKEIKQFFLVHAYFPFHGKSLQILYTVFVVNKVTALA